MRRTGWKTLDASRVYGADYIAAIPPLPEEVKAVQWEEIEWVHGITSLYPWQAREVLSEIKSILAPEGRLVLEQPDIRLCSTPQWIFGDPSSTDPLHMNHWGYTPISLTWLLYATGFSRVSVLPAQHHFPERDFRIECSR